MVALPGVDPSWSAYLNVPSSSPADPDGTVNRWHYLDNLPSLTAEPRGTLLCVHGNPTWSYLWRSVLAAGAVQGWRVIAVDQLDMGLSERTGRRRLADRVQDLEDFTAALPLTGPVVTVGHDWGGVVSLGYADRNREDLAAVILTNTAIHQDPARPLPAPLRLALNRAVHRIGTSGTPAFLDTTLALARPRLSPEVRAAYRLPYLKASRRHGIAQFVADIPVDSSHPSHAPLAGIAEGIRSLTVPALMLWGPGDPIFSDTYLEDLSRRLPHADIHRFEGASHLVAEDRDIATEIFTWLDSTGSSTHDDDRRSDSAFTPLWHQVTARAAGPDATSCAVADMGSDGSIARSLTWRELEARIDALAAALAGIGVKAGSRVSLMVPPGVDLTVLIYACLRLGAVIVVADAGLGTRGLSRAVRGAVPDYLVGIERALVAARAFSWPGTRISVETLPRAKARLLGVSRSLQELARGAATPAALPDQADPDADAAVLFTSGSTGPAKGVVYTHRQLSAMRDTLAATLELRPGSALVAGFAPFALLGPALGAASVTPDMDVTAPRTLSARALGDAAAAIAATVVFASPAALRNVLATAPGLSPAGAKALEQVKVLLSAGAPVPARLLEDLQPLVPRAELHTPYGMTECLPVTDIDLRGIQAAASSQAEGAGNGVCVGAPVPGARLAIVPLLADGSADGEPTTTAGVTGEILVNAAHVKDRYHRLWATERVASRTPGFHRTGDVGHLDANGNLWVEGRLAHIVTSASGVITPVGAELAIEELGSVRQAAVVGVGPSGAQAVVAVVVPVDSGRAGGTALAPLELADAVRQKAEGAGVRVDAVLTLPELPTDIRHNAKIDRSRVARWAGRVLEGRGKKRP